MKFFTWFVEKCISFHLCLFWQYVLEYKQRHFLKTFHSCNSNITMYMFYFYAKKFKKRFFEEGKFVVILKVRLGYVK